MRKRKPTIALIYDFDGTLSPSNMQEYDFLKAIEIKDKKKFWSENSKMVIDHNASNILCYMKSQSIACKCEETAVCRIW